MAKIKDVIIVFSCLLSSAGLAGELSVVQRTYSIPEEVEIYSRELNIESNTANSSINVERLLQLGQQASVALVQPSSPGEADILERLSEDEFQTVVHKMKGFSVNRQETVFVEPDPNFFIALAKRGGDQASVDFFEVKKKTEYSYYRQQTDYNGCYLFGTLGMVDSYNQWIKYGNKYPARYSKDVKSQIRNIEDDITGGTCACDDKTSALREFEAFILAFPSAKIAERVRERINQINLGKSDIRENCINN